MPEMTTLRWRVCVTIVYGWDDADVCVIGDNQCIDIKADSGFTQSAPYSSLKDSQTWQCSGGNPNQVSSGGPREHVRS